MDRTINTSLGDFAELSQSGLIFFSIEPILSFFFFFELKSCPVFPAEFPWKQSGFLMVCLLLLLAERPNMPREEAGLSFSPFHRQRCLPVTGVGVAALTPGDGFWAHVAPEEMFLESSEWQEILVSEDSLSLCSHRLWLGFSALSGLVWMVFYQSDEIIFNY